MEYKPELIQLVQLPIIEEHLLPLKEKWEKKAEFAKQLACTEQTLADVKKVRAAMRKQYEELEEARKAVKKAVNEPYKQFEQIYADCVTKSFTEADNAFVSKINEVEESMKSRVEDGIKDYFDELIVSAHLEWLTFDKLGIKIDLTEARKKTNRSLKEKISDAVERVMAEVELISTLDHSDEIMVEYRETLDMNGSFVKVKERHAKLANVQKDTVQRNAENAKETEHIKKVEALAPPVPIEPKEVESAPKLITAAFKVTDTRERLIALRTWLHENGYKIQ